MANDSEKLWYCTACGEVGHPKKYTKGSFLIEVLLWLLMLLPGALYTLWRLTSKYKGCPKCGAPGMIPATSPKARQALAKSALSRTHEHDGIVTDEGFRAR